MMPSFETPQRLEILSTKSEEIAPVPFSNGEKLYFVRAIQEGKAEERKAGQEIWTSERIGDSWSEPQRVLKEANDLGNNGVIGSSADGSKIYVFNSTQSRRKRARGIAYLEKQEDGSWGELEKLKIDGFKIGDGYYSFYMNRTEDVLLISMAPDKKTINEDLFVSIKDEEGKWSEVQSLGSKINTPGVELSPFITEDKSALYFASNGHGGEGNVDVFISFRLGDGWNNWTTPKNLGSQINSKEFDGYFIIGNNKEVFFVSDRASAAGDVYTTRLVDRNEVNGQFLYKGLAAENVTLEVYDELGNIVDTLITDESGNFSYRKLSPDEKYFLKVAEEDAAEYPNAVFYELDPDGNKSSRSVLTKTGRFVSENEVKDGENVVGTFTYDNLPLENAYLLVFDEKGDVVDTIITDASGNFIYKKLNANANYTFKPLDIDNSDEVFVDITDPELNLVGKFTYNSLPLQNEALLVLGETGDIVDTIYTNNEGKFNYTKLGADNNYSFKPAVINDDELKFDYTLEKPEKNAIGGTIKYKELPLRSTPVLVKDKNGSITDTIYTDANGKFNYNKPKADEEYTFEALTKGNNPDLVASSFSQIEKEEVRGIFRYKDLPLENKALVVYDETGFPIDTIYTDENGKFQYQKLKGESNYTMKPLDEDDINFEDLIMTLSSDEDISNLENVQGTFKYKSLPLKNEGLVIIDENGFPIDTIFTDENGRFQYQKLKGETNYTMKPLNEEDINFDDLIMTILIGDGFADNEQITGDLKYKNQPLKSEALVVLNEKGLPIDTIYTDESGKFVYDKDKGEDNYTVQLLNDKDRDVVDVLMVLNSADETTEKEKEDIAVIDDKDKKRDQENETILPKASNEAFSLSNVIYFNFDEFVLTPDDYAALDKIISSKGKIKELVLEGHADSLGTLETNMNFSKLRIESTVNYLVERGFNPEIIKRIPVGESQPVEDNATEAGRAKNRRVVYICN